jgi:hypothetical protein
VNRAIAAVARHDPRCNDDLVEGKVSQGSPARLMSLLGLLRRRARPGDIPVRAVPPSVPYRLRKIPSLLEGFEQQGTVYVNRIRRARTVNGHAFYMVPIIRGVRVKAPARCLREQRSELDSLIIRLPAIERRAAIAVADTTLAGERRVVHPYEGIMTYVSEGFGGYGGCCTTALDLRDGRLGGVTSGGGTGQNQRSSTLDMLIPDGAARVRLTFRAGAPHFPPGEAPPGTSTKPYSTLSITARPVGNFLVVTIPRSAEDGFPDSITLLTRTGHVIRTIRPR